MIYVLTRDSHAKSQLSLLFRELGFNAECYSAINECEADVSVATIPSTVFLDLRLITNSTFCEALKIAAPNAYLIGFRPLEALSGTPPLSEKPTGLDAFFLLPPNAERAKARLKTLLREHGATPGIPRHTGSTLTRTPFRLPGRLSRPPLRALKGTGALDPVEARYVEARSPTARSFVQQLRDLDPASYLILLMGQEGAEFETAARELNFQQTQDRAQLILEPTDALTLDRLEKLEKEATNARQRRFCYVGKTEDLSSDAASHLMLFVQFLATLRNPHLSIVLAHEHGTRPFFQADVEDTLKPSLSKGTALEIPGIPQRAEDIRPISLALLSHLRMAHPFLRIHGISEAGIDYLVEIRGTLSHGKLIRILRNAIALSPRDVLMVEDLKNYGEHDTSTSHLVESMADEQFFPAQEAINS